MKSAPAIIATRDAFATLRRVSRSPEPRITFRWAGPPQSLKADDFVVQFLQMRSENMRARDERRQFLRARGDPNGEFPKRDLQRARVRWKTGGDGGDIILCLRARGARFLQTSDRRRPRHLNNSTPRFQLPQISCWIGCRALEQRRRTRSSVSSPLSVVKIHAKDCAEAARQSANLFHVSASANRGRRGVRRHWCDAYPFHPVQVE